MSLPRYGKGTGEEMKYDPLPWMWVAFVPQKKETKLLKENSIEYRIERRTLFVRSKDWEASRKLLLRHTRNRMSYYDYGGLNASNDN